VPTVWYGVSPMTNLEYLRDVVIGEKATTETPAFRYPPAISKTLGLKLVEIGERTATVEMTTSTESHANPMGTVHGGILCDLADCAIGTAHATMLSAGESFTSLDLQINFFRPVWNEKLRAVAKPVHSGKTISRYVCDVTKADGKLVAQIFSSVMTLRGKEASGR
jgi:uncharacterized protein (TIGR00369 family)